MLAVYSVHRNDTVQTSTADDDACSDGFEPYDLSEEDDDGKGAFMPNSCIPLTCTQICA